MRVLANGCLHNSTCVMSLRSLPMCSVKRRLWVPPHERRCPQPRAGGEADPGQSTGKDDQERSMEHIADEIIQQDPEVQKRLKRITEAAELVARLQEQQKDLERRMAEDATRDANSRAARAREAEQVALEKEAELMMLQAEAQVRAAEREVLEANWDRAKWASAIDEDAEKLESGKAAAIAAVGGAVGSLPYLLVSDHPLLSNILSAGAIMLSCFLFGVTYRYALRSDIGNLQLKSGVVAAFGLVRGIAAADVFQYTAADAGSSVFSTAVISSAALAAGESMLAFGFAAMAVEVAFQNGVLKPFGNAAGNVSNR